MAREAVKLTERERLAALDERLWLVEMLQAYGISRTKARRLLAAVERRSTARASRCAPAGTGGAAHGF